MKEFSSYYREWRQATRSRTDTPLKSLPMERFTTSKLAELVRTEPLPLLSLLRTKIWLPLAPPAAISVETFHAIPSGEIDMVMTASFGPQVKMTFWFELKIEASFGPGQVEKYERDAASRSSKPTVICLVKNEAQAGAGRHVITWTELCHCIPADGCGVRNWVEFHDFLRELRAAHRPVDPESHSQVESVLRRFTSGANAMLRGAAPTLQYYLPEGKEIASSMKVIWREARKHMCRVAIYEGWLQIAVGVDQNDCWVVQVLCQQTWDSKGRNIRPQIARLGMALPATFWEIPDHHFLSLEALCPRENLTSDADVLSWLQARWMELCDSGIPRLMAQYQK